MLSEHTILTWLLLAPVLGGLACLLLPSAQVRQARTVAMGFFVATFLLALLATSWFDWSRGGLYAAPPSPAPPPPLSAATLPATMPATMPGTSTAPATAAGVAAVYDPAHYRQTVQLALRWPWITSLNVHYYVGVDGLSLLLVVLTAGLMLVACWASYGINKSERAYFALLLFLTSGMIGVFVSLDLVLFYVFYEISLFPMYFLIGIWGGVRREYASVKFFLYALAGSIAILIVILGLFGQTQGLGRASGGAGGGAVFDLVQLATDPRIQASLAPGGAGAGFAAVAFWMLVLGFAVKMPLAPLHTWVADAHAEAPTPVAMVLSALVIKLGGYGLLRVAYPLFPAQAAANWAAVATLAVVSIVYCALVAMSQKDLRRMAAYASASQMGYVALGIAVMVPTGWTGAGYQMIGHAVSMALLFFIIGVIVDRAHHCEIARLGGLWAHLPSFTGWAALGFFAVLGLPGLCGFVGELLVVMGTCGAGGGRTGELLGGVAAAAVVLTGGYLLWTWQRVFMGTPKAEYQHFARLSASEKWILATLGVTAVALGVLPMLVLDRMRPAIESLLGG